VAGTEVIYRALELKPRLACDVVNDLRYVPPVETETIKVHTSWSIPHVSRRQCRLRPQGTRRNVRDLVR
jgi:hypothetical protein